MKKLLAFIIAGILLFTVGCSSKNGLTTPGKTEEKSQDIPTITISWGNELHTGIMNVLLKKVDEFKKSGVYMNPLSDEQFELIKDDKKIALLNFIKTKGGSEVATLMGQGHLDAAFTSNTAMLSAYDQGTKLKILSPVQTDGVGLVFGSDKNFYGWNDVKEYIKSSNTPMKLGYHSPVSGPRIVLESVLREQGLKVTEDPGDSTADVLLVDLKGAQNLLPSLSSKQVDGWIGPSHYPETAEYEKLGKIVLNLEDFPPIGQWGNFPCCVFAARDELIEKYPEVFKAMVQLITDDAKYCMDHKDEVSGILSEVIGVNEEAIKMSKIKYTTDPTDKWVDGIKVYYDAIDQMGKFSGDLKNKSFDEVKQKIFYFDYAKESNK